MRTATTIDYWMNNPGRLALLAKVAKDQIAENANTTDVKVRTDLASMPLFVAAISRGAPQFVVDPDCFDELSETDVVNGYLPRLPFTQWVVMAPPNRRFGWIDLECKIARRGVVITQVLTQRWVATAFGTAPDDIEAGGMIDSSIEQTISGNPFLINLFHLLQDRQLTTTEVVPQVPKSPKKLKRLQRKGLSTRPYTLISLTEPAKPRKTTHEPTGRTLRAHIRRGHWKRYWVLDADGRRVLAESISKTGKPLYQIAKWIRPHVVGKGTPGPRNYKVTL